MSLSLWKRLFGLSPSMSVPPPENRPLSAPRPKLQRSLSGAMEYPKMAARFGRKGQTKGCLNMPCGVAVTKTGK